MGCVGAGSSHSDEGSRGLHHELLGALALELDLPEAHGARAVALVPLHDAPVPGEGRREG